MGRLSPVHRRDGARVAPVGHAYPAAGIYSDGTLAGVDRHSSYWPRDLPAQPAPQRDPHSYLTTLLSPIDESPDALASRLLYRFGSIGKIAQASDNELRQAAVSGERWVDAFLMVRRLMHDGMREELVRTRLGEDRNALFSYLSLTMKNLPEERMIAIFADAASFVIAEEIIAEGGDAHILITPRRILGRAMNLDARRIVLAHNHPSGCAEPSERDIKNTLVLCRQARELGMVIEDHLIIGHRNVVSMKDRGLI